MAETGLLSVMELDKTFRVRTSALSRHRAEVHAVRQVSFDVSEGEAGPGHSRRRDRGRDGDRAAPFGEDFEGVIPNLRRR